MKPRTLYGKIWDAHVVAGRKLRRPDLTLAVPDHNLPITARVDMTGAMNPRLDEVGMTMARDAAISGFERRDAFRRSCLPPHDASGIFLRGHI